jgi:hypothetical protein
MEDNTDIARIVRDIRQIKMGIGLILALGLAMLAGHIFLLVKLPDILQLTTAGTEPPIRVRGGSLHFDLLAGGSHWEPTHGNDADGDHKDTDWTLAPGHRKSDNVRLLLAGIVPTEDCDMLRTVKKATFSYKSNDGTVTNEVTLHATGNKTTIQADKPLELQPDGSLVFDLDHQGYISAIKGTGGGLPLSCTFSDGNGLSDVTATEY